MKIPRLSVNEGIKFVSYGIVNKKISEEEFYKNELKYIEKKLIKI